LEACGGTAGYLNVVRETVFALFMDVPVALLAIKVAILLEHGFLARTPVANTLSAL
jgi:hypothetical protein